MQENANRQGQAFLRHPLIPWVLTVLMSLYVYALHYYATHQNPPEPSYTFYDTTIVSVLLQPASEGDVYGEFNNILGGNRLLVKARAQQPGHYRLRFEVNSPRPAVLYIGSEKFDVFLSPGDTTLRVHARLNPDGLQVDSLGFDGRNANICRYYRERQLHFSQPQLRAGRLALDSEHFQRFSTRLDSMAARELAFLAEQEVFSTLPDWFVSFEKSDILYQKAYLKLIASQNRDIPPGLWQDPVAIDNRQAVFSYYYYLYLGQYFKRQLPEGSGEAEEAAGQVRMAGEWLSDGPRDIFLTRTAFDLIEKDRVELADEVVAQAVPMFTSPKYPRFLKSLLADKHTAAR